MKTAPDAQSAYADIASRFQVLAGLFTTLGSPENTKELLEGLMSGDPTRFERWTGKLDLPFAGRCFWLREVIERVVSSPPRLVTECSIRGDLTLPERVLLWMISRRHGQVSVHTGGWLVVGGTAAVIPDGPYLEELKANGLVTCVDRWVSDAVTTIVLGPPERVCL